MMPQLDPPVDEVLFGFKFEKGGYYRYYDGNTHSFSAPGNLTSILDLENIERIWDNLKLNGYTELLDISTEVLVLDLIRCQIRYGGVFLAKIWDTINTRVYVDKETFEAPTLPSPLPEKSPMRLVSIDCLEKGEETLPSNFTLIFSPEWLAHEIRDMKELYQRVLPVIGVSGKAVFLNSKFQGTNVEKFLAKYQRR